MEDPKNQGAQNQQNIEDHTDYELSHTDKLVGVFSEPISTFSRIAGFPAKTIDWLIPVIIVIVIATVANILMMSNPAIKYSVIEQQMERIEQNLNEMVAEGRLTQEQAEQQMEQIRDRIENQIGAGMILQIVGIIIVTFIVFFIVSSVFFLLAKFLFKGEGTYRSAMVAYGLPYYIIVIQIIVMVILALSMDKFFQSTSVAAFLDLPPRTFSGYLLNKLDIFSIWFYTIVGIGFAKMFKSDKIGKYLAMTFGAWIGFSIIMYFLAQAIPLLRWFVI
ncbi:MAG: hypothetical protein A2V66_01445 [Ignavibacteria bacterium RBG_13_36_8]|nr:MAG: hypothetical protein A2V66_01445 [Ignavibacteria bacterium RBG_13_36_8]